jgi:hypothetical protein
MDFSRPQQGASYLGSRRISCGLFGRVLFTIALLLTLESTIFFGKNSALASIREDLLPPAKISLFVNR